MSKQALFRHRIIDKYLSNSLSRYPSKEDLRRACEHELFGTDLGLHICDSTIEKDLRSMRDEYDAPIKYHRFHKGYYYSDPNFRINDLPLSESNLTAIRFAANTLLQFKDVAIFREFSHTIDKMMERISLNSQIKPKELQEYVQFETHTSVGGSEHLQPLLKAIQESTLVYFEYENFRTGIIKTRKVCPLLLKEYRNRWYLISFDYIKEKITTYALERMHNLDFTKQKVSKPQDFNPQLFFEHSIGISTGETHPEIIRFKADKTAAKYIESQPFHATQKLIKHASDHSIFELCVFVSEEFIRSILSFGGEISIIEPKSLRKTIQERIHKMVVNYQQENPNG